MTPFLPATVFFGPLRVRALVRVRWPRTGQAAAMTHAAVAGDVLQARNVLSHLPAKLAFDDVVLVQQRGEAGHFVLAQLAGVGLRVDARLVAQLAGRLRADAVQVRQRDDRRAIVRNVNTQQTRHNLLRYSLRTCCS